MPWRRAVGSSIQAVRGAAETRRWRRGGPGPLPVLTSAASPASGRATPTTRSGHADRPSACPRSGNWTPVAVLTVRSLPAPSDVVLGRIVLDPSFGTATGTPEHSP